MYTIQMSEPLTFPVLSGSLEDLSYIMLGIREKVIRMSAKISKIPIDDAIEKLIHNKTAKVVSVDKMIVPSVQQSKSSIYTPPPVPPTTARTSTKSKTPYFQNGMTISRLEAMRVWNPSTYCHGRKRIGFCGRKQVKTDDTDSPPLCKQCKGIYDKFKANIQGGWRGFVTEPFLRKINPKEFDAVKKMGEGNTYINSDGDRVMCKWKYAKYYWPYYHETVGMVYYDIRSGMAITKLPVDWERGHPHDQSDPIMGCTKDEIIDLRTHLNERGFKLEG